MAEKIKNIYSWLKEELVGVLASSTHVDHICN